MVSIFFPSVEKINNILKGEIISSVFYILLGLCLILIPTQTVDVICKVVFGLILIGVGIYHIYIYIRGKAKATIMDLLSGVVVFVLGVFLFMTPSIVIKLLPWMLSAFVLVDSLWKFKGAFLLKKGGNGAWSVLLIGSLVFIALGIVMLFGRFPKIMTLLIFSGPYIKKTGYIECPHCAAKIDEAQRKKLITKKLNKTFQVIKTSESAIQLTNKNGKDVRVDFYEIDPNPKKDYETVGLDVNSFVSGLVTLSMIIEEKYAAVSAYENLTDSEKIKKFYIGYGNRPFIGKIQEAGKHKDILLLGNGLGRGVLPLNTSFLALNVDTQKDYLVYTLVAIDDMANVHLVDCGELYGANQFATLFDMLRSTYYDSDGEGHGINAYGHDRLGIKERTMAVDQFLAELITDYKMGHDDLGIVYPLMGAPDNRQGKRVWLVNKEFKDSPLSYSLGFNANLAKTLFSEYLMRSVTNIKSELGEKSGLFFVNQDIVNEGLSRDRPLATSPEMQLTSEELRYEVKNGKTAAKATWQVVYNGRPNHILDCVSGALSLAYFKELFLFRRSANTL